MDSVKTFFNFYFNILFSILKNIHRYTKIVLKWEKMDSMETKEKCHTWGKPSTVVAIFAFYCTKTDQNESDFCYEMNLSVYHQHISKTYIYSSYLALLMLEDKEHFCYIYQL